MRLSSLGNSGVMSAAVILSLWPFGLFATCIDYNDYWVGSIALPTALPPQYLPRGAPATDVAVSDDHAFVTCGRAGLQVIDISDPSNPWIVSSVPTLGTAENVVISDVLPARLLNASYTYTLNYSGTLTGYDTFTWPAFQDFCPGGC